MLDMLQPLTSISEDTYRPKKTDEIERLFIEKDYHKALHELSLLEGGNVFIHEQLAKGHTFEGRIHGLASKKEDAVLDEWMILRYF